MEAAEKQLAKGEEQPAKEPEPGDDEDLEVLKEESINLRNKTAVARTRWP